MLVAAELIKVMIDLVENKGLLLLVEASTLEHLADDVCAIRVNRKLTDVTLEGFADEVLLMVHCHIVEDGLNRMCALLVAADLNKIVPNHIQDAKALVY